MGELIGIIEVDRVKYRISYRDDGEIVFFRADWEITDDFERVLVYTDDFDGHTKNPLKVIRKVRDATRVWIEKTKPKVVWFEANSDKKQAIYDRLFKEVSSKEEYNAVAQDGKYYLYRLRQW